MLRRRRRRVEGAGRAAAVAAAEDPAFEPDALVAAVIDCFFEVEADSTHLHCPSPYGGDRLVCTGTRDGVRYTVVAPRGDCDAATLTCQTWNWDRMTVRTDGRS